MLIALFPNEKKTHSLAIASDVASFLKKHNIQAVAEDSLASSIGADLLSTVEMEAIDFRISFGGDGTILRLVHRYPTLRAPLLGINLGSLGFLADIPVEDLFPSLQDFVDGRFTIQKRMMMEGSLIKGNDCFAVNEITIHRGSNPSLVDFAIHVDGKYVNTFSADGVIVSTPSGSTAYSLAAGGPILTPELHAFVITPICPHTISNRPIVLMPKHEMVIRYLSHHNPVEISCDGIDSGSLATGDTITITLSKHFFSLVNLARHEYFSTLREKLGWQGKLKS